MQHLVGVHYATALILNLGYYTIRLSPTSQDMTTIDTEFGKFGYNILPMGMCASGDIFQAKVDEILGDIEGFKMYIDDILVLGKNSFENHIDQLRIIFGRLRAAGLQVNAPKCCFGLKEIPYLGCVLTRESIKPEPKKVQGIMYLGRTSKTTRVRLLIGMVQYYRDMWPRRSYLVVPLTEAAIGSKWENVFWNDGLESSLK